MTEIKILHTSDWHLGRSLFDFSLLEDQKFLLEQIYQVITEQEVDAIIIAGDLFDRSLPSAQAVQLLDHAFSRMIHQLHIKVFAIGGNHDSSKRIDYGNSIFQESGLFLEGSWNPKIKKITLEDEFGPLNFFLLPFFLQQELKLAYADKTITSFSQSIEEILHDNQDAIDTHERNILIAHGFFMKLQQNNSFEKDPLLPICSGSELSVGTSELMDLSSADIFDYVALGHLHSAQCAGCETMRYSGSIMKYSISEALNHKSLTLLDFKEKGNLIISQIPLFPKRDLRVITGTFDELMCKKDSVNADDYVFANIVHTGAVLHAMGQLRSIFPNMIGLHFMTQEQAQESLYVSPGEIPMDQLFAQFYHEVQNIELSDERQKIVADIINQLDKGEESQ